MASNTRFGPTRPPKPLKLLVLITFFISLFTALFNNFFPHYFGTPNLEQLLGLSSWGIHRLFFWQFISYFFIHPVPHGLSFSFLISLGFSLYLVWVVGTSIYERRGLSSFFSLYFSSGIFVGLILFFFQNLFQTQIIFANNTPTLYAILIAWIMLYPEAQLLVLLALPIKARWLILIILSANLLIDLSVGQWLNALAYSSGALFGYLYSLLFWKTKGPFPAFHPFEEKLIKFMGGTQIDKAFPHSRTKIYDFKTGKAIIKDEDFLEEMLSKISLYGKNSLTWRERLRLRSITKKRRKNKK